MQCSAVVFDLFHTIVDPEDFRPKEHRRTEQVAKLLGVDARKFSTYWFETMTLRDTSRAMSPLHLVETFLAREGLQRDRALLTQVDCELGRFQDMALLNPRPEVVSALQALRSRGLKLGLLSNCDEREVRDWAKSPVAQFFDSVCFSFDLGVVKPDPRSYNTVLERLGEAPKNAAFVGDGGSNELEGAKAAHFKLVVFMEGFVASNAEYTPSKIQELRKVADVTIRRLDELPPLFKPV